MRFEEAYGGWRESRLTQEEAAQLLGVSSLPAIKLKADNLFATEPDISICC
jgi:hypothetical protein